MTRISRTDAEALATFIRRLRPDWNQPGTVAAIQRCQTGALSEVAVALIRLAEDGTIKSPDMLSSPGHWWFRAARGEQPTGEAIRNRDMCPEHPRHERVGCRECDAQSGPAVTPEFLAKCRAEVAAAAAAGKDAVLAQASRRRGVEVAS